MNATPFRLRKGDLLQLEDRLHEVTVSDVGGCNLLPLSGSSAPVRLTFDELKRLYFADEGTLKIVRGALNPRGESLRDVIDTPSECFDPRDRDAALVRLEYVTLCERFFNARRASRTPAGYRRVAKVGAWLRRRAQARGTGKPARAFALETFGGTTVREWHWRWRDSGRTLNALIPLNHRKGRKAEHIDPIVLGFMNHRVRKHYLSLERPPLSTILEAIEGDVRDYRGRHGVELQMPSASTIRRWVKSTVSEFDLVLKREGPRAAEDRFRHVKRAPGATRPLEIVQIDHTLLDVQTLDGKAVRRPWLTLAICVATRMIVGFYISYEQPSWTSVMACLRMAVLPKDDVLASVATVSRWPVYGVPEIVVVDNGREFHSKSMKAAAGHLDYELRYAPVRKPHLKGVVERNLGEVARNFLSFMPGRTFANVREKGDYRSADLAGLTLEDLREAFTIWAVDYHNNKPHSAHLGVPPLARWNELAHYGVRLPPKASDLDALIGLVVERQIRRDGIEYLGLMYQSDQLRAMRRRPGHAGKMWMVKVDPLDMGQLLVLDEDRKRWISVPSSDPELTTDLTLAEWKQITEDAKARAQAGKRVSRDALLSAHNRLFAIGERAGAGRHPKSAVEMPDWTEDYRTRATPTFTGPSEADPIQARRNRKSRQDPHPAAAVSEGAGLDFDGLRNGRPVVNAPSVDAAAALGSGRISWDDDEDETTWE